MFSRIKVAFSTTALAHHLHISTIHKSYFILFTEIVFHTKQLTTYFILGAKQARNTKGVTLQCGHLMLQCPFTSTIVFKDLD